MRSFVAVELPEITLKSLAALSARLRASGARASWAKPENMHLTLRFLGDVDERSLDRLAEYFAEACKEVSPFPLSVRGTGAFPNLRRPSVVWAGAGPVEGGLAQIQSAAENAARAMGLPPDEKEFRPHLTLARIKDPREAAPLVALLEKERDFSTDEFSVSNVSLFSSRLTPHGPIYTRLREFGL